MKGVMVLAAVLIVVATGHATTVTVDENGNGNIDGTPITPAFGGGIYSFSLPFSTTPGDVFITDSEPAPICAASTTCTDVIRFVGNGVMAFYSRANDGIDSSFADSTTFPTMFSNNYTFISETGTENDNSAFWIPADSGDPGFVAGQTTRYHFISDAPVPEPSSLVLVGSGLAALVSLARRKLRV